MITLLVLLVLAIAVVLGVPAIRKKVVTRPVFGIFKKILPPLSATEREAMEAGSVWWDGELFRGNPDWKKLHGYGKAELSAEEQAFIDGPVEKGQTIKEVTHDLPSFSRSSGSGHSA